jgi:hypothetical protein
MAYRPTPRLSNNYVPRKFKSDLKVDQSMRDWLEQQDWSDFAQSLVMYYDNNDGFSPAQYESARKMRYKLDDSYDIYGLSVENGAYYDPENKEIYKLSWVTKNDYKSRSLRKRDVDSPNWREVKNGYRLNDRDNFFQSVKCGDFYKLTEEQMVQIGKDTGICAVCGKTLDNPKSIAAGIGPYCAKQQKNID